MSDFDVVITDLDIGQVEHSILGRLYQYWTDKKGPRIAPSRADIDPLDLGFILSHLLLFDVIENGVDFRARLAGTSTYPLHSEDITGSLMSQVRPLEFSVAIIAQYRRIVASRAPTFSRTTYLDHGAEVEAYHALRLPLSSNGTDIDMILVGEDYGDNPHGLYEAMAKGM